MDKYSWWQILIVVIVLGVIATSPAACTMYRQRLIADAIQQGADPIAVRCALESMNDNSAMCISKAVSSNAAEKKQ